MDHALGLIAKTGAIQTTLERAAEYASAAKVALRGFGDSKIRGQLSAIADYTVRRLR